MKKALLAAVALVALPVVAQAQVPQPVRLLDAG